MRPSQAAGAARLRSCAGALVCCHVAASRRRSQQALGSSYALAHPHEQITRENGVVLFQQAACWGQACTRARPVKTS